MPPAINPVRGTDHPLSKLTDDDIRLIRECVAERERLINEARKLTNAELAKKFDVHANTIGRVTQFRGWVHV
jgi:hypothetical protein